MAAYSFQKDPWSGVTSRNGIPADELPSMLRGAIRRGEEKTALAAAYEMYLTSPQLLDRAWRSLLSASVEDVGFGAPEAPETVWALYGMRRSFDYTDGDQPIFLVYAVRCLCRSRKDRSSGESAYMLAKRFAAGYIPEVPDYAYDMHTVQGRELGRGELHFLEEASKVSPQLESGWVKTLHDDFIAMCQLEKEASGRPIVEAFLRCEWEY